MKKELSVNYSPPLIFSILLIFLVQLNIFAQDFTSIFEVYNVKEIFHKKREMNSNIGMAQVINNIFSTISISNDSLGRKSIVYFPPGLYEISETIKIPPRTYVVGLSGNYNLSAANQGIKELIEHQPVVIRWKGDPNLNMVEPVNNFMENEGTLESVIIQGLTFDGNNKAQNGIYLPVIHKSVERGRTRSGFILRESLLCNMRGCGFMADSNQSEVFLEKVIAMYNNECGFKFVSGSDINLTSVGAGGNRQNGFYFGGIDNLRSFNCDSWGNEYNGVYLKGGSGLSFHRLQCDLNKKNGLVIQGSSGCDFIGSLFKLNSKGSQGQYSEVLLKNNSYNNPFGIRFVSCQIGQNQLWKTAFGIIDSSINVKTNSIIGCTFQEGEFLEGIFNEAVLFNYNIESCTSGEWGGEQYFHPFEFVVIRDSIYNLSRKHHTLFIDSDNDLVQINLPELNDSVPLGKEYLILTKLGAKTHICIYPHNGLTSNTINGLPKPYCFGEGTTSYIRVLRISEIDWKIIQ